MNRKGQSRVGTLFFTVIIMLLIAGGFYFLSQRSTTVINTPLPNKGDTSVLPDEDEGGVDPVVQSWQTFTNSDLGIEFKYPNYIKVNPDAKIERGSLSPTALSYYTFSFSPNPNTDFETLSASVEVDAAKNFVFNLGDRFVSYEISTNTWYVNKDSRDKPSVSSPTYKNLYKDGNQFKPTVFGKTSDGYVIYGLFTLGDESRGSETYLVPIPEKNVVLNVTVRFNQTALEGSSASIRSLKKTFDADLPHLLKSIGIAK